MKRFISIVLIPAFLNFSGCSLLVPHSQSINITPSNPNADIFVDGNNVGHGPVSIMLNKSSTHSIMAKCGNSAGTAIIDRQFSTTGYLDLVGGLIILLPLIGLVSPGSHKLTPSTISVAIPDDTACKTAS